MSEYYCKLADLIASLPFSLTDEGRRSIEQAWLMMVDTDSHYPYLEPYQPLRLKLIASAAGRAVYKFWFSWDCSPGYLSVTPEDCQFLTEQLVARILRPQEGLSWLT